MQIDWTTFLLEILNFIVLMWILKRYFYQPVLDVLDRRTARIKTENDKATALKQEADMLKNQYEARMQDWNKEREQRLRALDGEIAQERSRRMEELKKKLAEEASATHAREQSACAAREAVLKEQIHGKAFAAAGAMLKRMASPELTATIATLFEQDLAALSHEKLAELRHSRADKAEIKSAHALAAPVRKSLVSALARAAGGDVEASFSEDEKLIAGLRISLGEYILSADLASELEFFRQRSSNG